MFGATMNTYTLFHTAEDVAGCPYLYDPQPQQLRAVDASGQPVTVEMLRQNMRVARRFEQMDRVLEAAGLLRRQWLGRGELLFLPSSREVHKFLLRHLKEDPYYLTAGKGDSSL
jgi:aminoglycoside N3'-acetyltransferase